LKYFGLRKIRIRSEIDNIEAISKDNKTMQLRERERRGRARESKREQERARESKRAGRVLWSGLNDASPELSASCRGRWRSYLCSYNRQITF
jgi:hypothetical protein